jgi:hypothetical protein
LGDLFGGGGSESKSENLAYPWIKDNFGSTSSGAYNMGLGNIGSILSGNSQALDNFWENGGGSFLMEKGTDDITAKMAKLGLTKSGATVKGLEDYRQGLASTKLGELLGHFGNLAQLGLGGGNLVANAGQVSSGTSGGGGGLGSLLGAALAFV